MTVGDRLRSERIRLGMSQPAFAALAGASKGAQAKWEKNEASPNAIALIAFAEAGVDVLYVLTGRQTSDRRDNAHSQIEDQLAEIRRDVLDPSKRRLPEEDEREAEERVLAQHTRALKAMLIHDAPFLTKELADEVEHMLDIVENPASLSLYRAADFVQMKRRRDQVKQQLWEWFDGIGHRPGGTVATLLTTLALEYGVPVRFIVELVHEVQEDMRKQLGVAVPLIGTDEVAAGLRASTAHDQSAAEEWGLPDLAPRTE